MIGSKYWTLTGFNWTLRLYKLQARSLYSAWSFKMANLRSKCHLRPIVHFDTKWLLSHHPLSQTAKEVSEIRRSNDLHSSDKNVQIRICASNFHRHSPAPNRRYLPAFLWLYVRIDMAARDLTVSHMSLSFTHPFTMTNWLYNPASFGR